MTLPALLAAAVLSQTPSAVVDTPLSELLGLTPAQVASRLGAVPDPAPGEGLRITDGGRVIEIHPIQRFWREPAMHADIGVRPDGVRCTTGVISAPGGLPESRGQFVFIDSVLRSVHVAEPRPVASPPRDLDAARDYSRRRALGSPWAPSPGSLPLGDGETVMARLPPAMSGDAVIQSVCTPDPGQADALPTSGEIALAAAGATVLWPIYAVTQPFVSAENRRAEEEGGALVHRLTPGTELPQSAEELVRGERGVRLFRDAADPDYGVLAIRLGARGTTPGVAMVGIRGRRVIWAAGPHATRRLGLADALCLDSDGLLDDVRPGCSAYGYRP